MRLSFIFIHVAPKVIRCFQRSLYMMELRGWQNQIHSFVMLPRESLMNIIYLNLVSKGDFSGQKKCKLFLPREMFIAEFSAGKIYGPCFLYRKWILYIVKYFPLSSEHPGTLFTDKQSGKIGVFPFGGLFRWQNADFGIRCCLLCLSGDTQT